MSEMEQVSVEEMWKAKRKHWPDAMYVFDSIEHREQCVVRMWVGSRWTYLGDFCDTREEAIADAYHRLSPAPAEQSKPSLEETLSDDELAEYAAWDVGDYDWHFDVGRMARELVWRRKGSQR